MTNREGVVVSEIRSQATPARDELAEAIHAEICEESLEDCLDPDWRGKCARAADVLLSAGWSKPRTVNSAAELDALDPNAVCSFVDSNGVTYACTAAEWQMGGFFSTAEPFPMITVHTHAGST
ncbi:hypothetical protein ABIE52_003706 [Rhodococcus sp. OAS809]|uniref:hypothetical protein n=1 Tax=Rhodococcus sp. OAS809 TaxID=2663874 RepID=UPI00178B5548